MFNFLKKKVELRLDDVEMAFIKAITNQLSTKYPLFKQECELGTFVGVGKNPGGSSGSFTYLIDNNSWKKICDTSIDNFFIRNLKFSSYKGEKVTVDLFTSEGLIIGYKTSTDVKDIDVKTINVSEIWEKHFINKDYNEIEHITGVLTKEQLQKLDIAKNTFKMKIGESSFYPVQDIGDGNYLAIDKTGKVFKITHDPFEVKKVFDTIFELLERT